MYKSIVIILMLIFVLSVGSRAQDPAITYLSSSYRTTAGAIGPNGVVATTTYDVKINSPYTIILDSAIISGLTVIGDGIIIPTNKQGTIEFRILITKHQKNAVWYNGELEFEGIRVSANIHRSRIDRDKDYPAIVLYIRSNKSAQRIIKQQFDQEQSQFNK